MQSLRHRALLFLKHWIDLVQRFNVPVVIAAVIIAGFALGYTKNNLGMNTDTKDMLSPALEWRQLDLEYEKYFPQYDDNILVVVEAGTPDQALDAADLLYRELLQETDLFQSDNETSTLYEILRSTCSAIFNKASSMATSLKSTEMIVFNDSRFFLSTSCGAK